MSVVAAQGFRAVGVAAGIKTAGGLDLALVVNDGPSRAAAGVFTRNKVKAAPVLWSMQVLDSGELRAVVLNSGGANACTGPQGFQTTHATAEHVAGELGCGAGEVAVCSTGLIGEQLPQAKLLTGVTTAFLELDRTQHAGDTATAAILTTDTRAKQAVYRDPSGFTVGGFAKGAGMIAPSMATMLAVLTTDADVGVEVLRAALLTATHRTFNRLDVDGGTSTNDTLLLLASGASRIRPDEQAFTAAVTAVCDDLVRQLQADAEGMTKLVTVVVRGAASEDDALAVGHTVARDSLVKTALFGSDPNWGRIAMAVGNAPAAVDPDTLGITINGVTLCHGGVAAGDRSKADLTGQEVEIVIDLGIGDGAADILTTDLSHAYVEENSAYSS
ncbi:MAG: bifunctional glutamate N-acetyltransferase/amino-acid acetyltransferase ArgJ [Pseudonocardia sp.]